MEGEIKNFIVVWITVLASLFYCHTIGKFIPKGTTRLFTLLPIISLFLFLHLNLTTIHLGSITCFFIAWLANFKLLLFAFGQGPLSSPSSSSSPPSPHISFPRFVLIACLPIKIHHHPPPPPNLEKPSKIEIKEYPSHKSPKTVLLRAQNPITKPDTTRSAELGSKGFHKSPLDYATKVVFIAILLRVYKYKEHVHPKLILLVYCFHVYVSLELLLALMTVLARAIGQVELQPPFNEPYRSNSLQDFWGRRWNLIVASILRPTVYDPVRRISGRLMGKKWASVMAIIATFSVSGLMHELVFYNMGREKPTWEGTWFCVIHGVCLVLEIWVKKALNGKFRLPAIVSGPVVVVFVVATGSWLFIPAFLRCHADFRVRREIATFVEFVKEIVGSFGFRSFNVVSVPHGD
ncbi:hypothetical protein CsSME_00018154 [Camellia sinensis var. sinensis]